ncbi:chromate transporter, partial [Undibacterium sp. LFS511W]|nr:chromate transporter [Undibacterium luofuense]
IAWLFIAAGALVWLVRTKPRFGSTNLGLVPLPLLGWMGNDANLLLQILLFFTKAGAFVFGSGLAVVPFLYGGVVTEHHWLTDKQFVDAVAVAMITPGPVVITTGF